MFSFQVFYPSDQFQIRFGDFPMPLYQSFFQLYGQLADGLIQLAVLPFLSFTDVICSPRSNSFAPFVNS